MQDEDSISQGGIAADARGRAVRLRKPAKRAFDVVAATICLILFTPILLIASVAIKLDSRGPILIRETLYGYKNRAIHVRRFRIDQPLTRVGRILRRTGIEELPLFINVLSGEMSIIGPHPCTHPSTLLNRDKPGMTSWAQIVGFQNRQEH